MYCGPTTVDHINAGNKIVDEAYQKAVACYDSLEPKEQVEWQKLQMFESTLGRVGHGYMATRESVNELREYLL
jgi:hypothetical protein